MKPLSDLLVDWPLIDRLLDEALDLPPHERLAWLDGLDESHAPISTTLRRLLLANGAIETGGFMGTLPKLGAVAAADGGGPSAQDTVGPWRLLRELGQGGMGSVWLAERVDGQLKRPVALKLPRLSWARGLAERMARERDILATLEHPHIARLYDASVDAAGRPWLALEYVQGQPIDLYVKDKALTVRQRVELLLQVCEAVAYAHSRLVIHRDLKPANILVTNEGQVRLLDFGIAGLVSVTGGAAEATLTAQAGRPLTPAYASPEQVLGEPLTTASDVYSLGVVAYELLTEARPYRLRRGSAAELEEAVAQAEIALPSSTTEQPGRRELLRGNLDAILMRALGRRPVDRYATVDALRRDLAAHLSGDRVEARRDTLALRAVRWSRRHRWPLAGVAAAAAAYALAFGLGATALTITGLLVGLVAAAWQTRQVRRRAREAEAAVRRAEAVQSYLQGLFRANSAFQADPQKARQTTARELLDIGAQTLSESLRDHPGAQAEMALTLADMYDELGLPEPSAALARRAVQLAETAGGERSELLLKALMRLIYELNHTAGGQDERRAAGDRLAAIAQNSLHQPSALRAKAWTLVAQSRRGEESRRWAVRAVAEAEAVGATGVAREAHEIAGQQCLSASDIGGAADHFARALAHHEQQPAQQRHDASTIFIRTGLGECRLALFQAAAAEATLAEAVRIAARTTGENRIDHLQTRVRLARVVAARGRSAEALAELQALLAITEAQDTSDAFCGLAVLLEMGNAQADAGLVDVAIATLELAVQRADALRPNAPQAALSRERLAQALLDARRTDEALLRLSEAEALRQALATPVDSPAWLPIAQARARAAMLAGHWDAARELLAAPAVWRNGGLSQMPALRTRILALAVEVGARRAERAAEQAAPLLAWMSAQPLQDELPLAFTEIELNAGEAAWLRGDAEAAARHWAHARALIERSALGPQGQWRTLCDMFLRCGQAAPTWPSA